MHILFQNIYLIIKNNTILLPDNNNNKNYDNKRNLFQIVIIVKKL